MISPETTNTAESRQETVTREFVCVSQEPKREDQERLGISGSQDDTQRCEPERRPSDPDLRQTTWRVKRCSMGLWTGWSGRNLAIGVGWIELDCLVLWLWSGSACLIVSGLLVEVSILSERSSLKLYIEPRQGSSSRVCSSAGFQDYGRCGLTCLWWWWCSQWYVRGRLMPPVSDRIYIR